MVKSEKKSGVEYEDVSSYMLLNYANQELTCSCVQIQLSRRVKKSSEKQNPVGQKLNEPTKVPLSCEDGHDFRIHL